MADEPILCFDGDKAGQKAAWRAADLALPLLQPGKSLRFALLPEGQDPDDLARSGGRARDRGSDLGRARPRGRDLVARNRRQFLCDAGAARGAGKAHRRIIQRHPRRGGAALLSPGSRRAAAADVCAGGRSRRFCTRQFSRPGRQFRPRIRPRFYPPGLVHPGRGGPNRTKIRPVPSLCQQPDHQPRPLSGREFPARQQPDHAGASAARCRAGKP